MLSTHEKMHIKKYRLQQSLQSLLIVILNSRKNRESTFIARISQLREKRLRQGNRGEGKESKKNVVRITPPVCHIL
jgi:hypothetical protein